ncbi:unnamed protein product, partial [Prorocentrum cordatum]
EGEEEEEELEEQEEEEQEALRRPEHTERPRAPSQGMHETPSKHGEHHALARTAQSCRRAPVRSVPAGAPAVAPGSPSQALQGNRRAELPYLIILLACRIKSRCGILENV